MIYLIYLNYACKIKSANKFTPKIALIVINLCRLQSNHYLYIVKAPFSYPLCISIEFLITICLVKNSIQISKPKHPVTPFQKPYEQLELVSHRDIQTHSKIMDKNTRASRSCIHHYFLVFGYITSQTWSNNSKQ